MPVRCSASPRDKALAPFLANAFLDCLSPPAGGTFEFHHATNCFCSAILASTSHHPHRASPYRCAALWLGSRPRGHTHPSKLDPHPTHRRSVVAPRVESQLRNQRGRLH